MTVSDKSLHGLVAEFVRLLRSGECNTIEEFAERYPGKVEPIRTELAGILLAEQLGGSFAEYVDVPETMGRYAVEEEIGRGGMGTVYSARHPTLGTDLALKVVPLSKIQGRDAEMRFEAEARACAAMDHAHIVPVFDYGMTDEFAYFAMRRIHGSSLEQITRPKAAETDAGQEVSFNPLGWIQIAKIGRQAADALQYSHDRGIVHRDVKPANLILDQQGKIWVTDFGLAKVRDDARDMSLTKTGDVVGTPRYMAPERLQGISSPTTDVFGLGLTLYELVTGQRVWNSLSDHQLAAKNETLALPDLKEVLPSVPEELSRIIMKACAFHSDDRYQSAAELRFVLDRFIDGVQVPDRRRKKNNARSRWRRKDVLYLSAAVAMLTVAFGTHWIWSLHNARKITSAKIVAAMENGDSKAAVMDALPDVIVQLAFGEEELEPEEIKDLTDRILTSVLKEFDLPESEQQEISTSYSLMTEKLAELPREMSALQEVTSTQQTTATQRNTKTPPAQSPVPFPHELLESIQCEILGSYVSREDKNKAIDILANAQRLANQRPLDPKPYVAVLLCKRFPQIERASAESDVAVTNWIGQLAECMAAPISTDGVNLISNGSFEANSIYGGMITLDASNVPSWHSWNGEQLELWSDGFNGVTSSDGSNHLELDHNAAGRTDAIYQDVQTQAGARYLLTFDVRGRGATLDSDDESAVVEWNGTKIKADGFKAQQEGEWQTIVVSVTGTGGLDRLQFRESSTTGASDGTGPFVDNISLERIVVSSATSR